MLQCSNSGLPEQDFAGGTECGQCCDVVLRPPGLKPIDMVCSVSWCARPDEAHQQPGGERPWAAGAVLKALQAARICGCDVDATARGALQVAVTGQCIGIVGCHPGQGRDSVIGGHTDRGTRADAQLASSAVKLARIQEYIGSHGCLWYLLNHGRYHPRDTFDWDFTGAQGCLAGSRRNALKTARPTAPALGSRLDTTTRDSIDRHHHGGCPGENRILAPEYNLAWRAELDHVSSMVAPVPRPTVNVLRTPATFARACVTSASNSAVQTALT